MFYKVQSDNFNNDILTKEAYHVLRLCMSTGDFGTHTAIMVGMVMPGTEVIEYDIETNEFYTGIHI